MPNYGVTSGFPRERVRQDECDAPRHRALQLVDVLQPGPQGFLALFQLIESALLYVDVCPTHIFTFQEFCLLAEKLPCCSAEFSCTRLGSMCHFFKLACLLLYVGPLSFERLPFGLYFVTLLGVAP